MFFFPQEGSYELLDRWIVSTIRIILDDLAPYQDGRLIPVDLLESFSSSLELVYRELLVQESLHGLTVLEREGCELIRHSMATFRIMHESQMQRDLPNASPPTEEGFIGRPRYIIKYDQLKMLLEHRFTVPHIANMLGVSVSTVRRRMAEFDLSVAATYATLTDDELDSLVSNIQNHFPNCGNRQMEGQLLARGFRIQHRIREAQRRADPEGFNTAASECSPAACVQGCCTTIPVAHRRKSQIN